MAVRVFLVADLKSMQELVRDLLDSVGGVIFKAQFAELRAYLQAFPGRVQRTEIA